MIRRKTSVAPVCAGTWLVFAIVGCGSSSESDRATDGGPDGETVAGMDMGGMASLDMAMGGMDMGEMEMGPMISCEGDPRVAMYMDGLTQTGLAGAAQVRILSATPSPPANGQNTWTIQLLDRTGAPLAATLGVVPDMPDHGHVSPQTPVAIPGATTGAYTLSNLSLFMAGVWRIQISVYSGTAADGGALLDIVTFYFCVEG